MSPIFKKVGLIFYNMILRILPLLILMPYLALGQSKMLSIDDAVLKQRTTLAPQRLMGLAWVANANAYTYYSKQNGKDCVVMQDAATLKTDTVLSIQRLNEILKKGVSGFKGIERILPHEWLTKTTFKFTYLNSIFIGDISNNSISVIAHLGEKNEHAEVDPTNKKVAYTINGNFLISTLNSFYEPIKPNAGSDDSGNKDFITKDAGVGISYGGTVHRNEFGIDKGIFWSPNGNRVAYYQLNESMVTDYPIYNLSTKPAITRNVKYPMSGATSHIAKVWVRDLLKNRSIQLQTGEPLEQYLTNVSWHPGEESVYIAVVNRAQNELKLNEYDGVTGAFVKTLFTETHPKYVEPEHAPVFVKNNPKQFIWMSERDGFNHLYLYSSTGRLDKQLTQGNFDVTQLLGFSNDGQFVFYMAASSDGMERHCFKTNLYSGVTKQLTLLPGVHQVMLSADGTYLIDVVSNANTPRRIVLLNADGAEQALLLNASNPIADYKKCEMRLFKIKAADGTTDLNCRMFLPADFDEKKKYPVLIYLYGGPHAQMITNSWLGGSDMWLYYMAQQGFVVFTVDNRGSANRGLNFENVTHRKLGVEESADQLKGVEYLKQQKFVDANRIGVYGWSFGGFMTTTLMTKTDVFKAGVAGGPVIDWSLYEIMYTERYMDSPAENKEGYEENNLLNHAKNLKGRLLMIHGTDDDVVVWQHSLQFVKKCVDEGVLLDYFVYPGHLHNVTGKDRLHLMQKITDHFKLHL